MLSKSRTCLRSPALTAALTAVLTAVLTVGQGRGGVSKQDLLRRGFSPITADEVSRSRMYGAPTVTEEEIPIPPPFVTEPEDPGVFDIPPPTRRFRQSGRKIDPVEGPTEPYAGRETDEIEGTFREVENFLLRPQHEYDRFVAMNEAGLTGLIQTATAQIAPKGTHHARFGLRHTRFRKSFGQTLEGDDSRIEQVLVPFTYMAVPDRDVELSLSFLGVAEDARNFGVIQDFQLAGLSTIELGSKYRWLDNPEHRLEAAVMFGIRSSVEPDVTRLGSDGVDYRFELAVTKRVENVALHADVGFFFVNGEDRSNDNVPDLSFINLAADFQTSDDLIWVLEVGYQDFRDIGDNIEIIPGLKWRIADRWRFDIGVPISISNELAQGYFYRFTTAFQVFW